MGIIGNRLHLPVRSAHRDRSDPFIHLSSFGRDRAKNSITKQVRWSPEGHGLYMGR